MSLPRRGEGGPAAVLLLLALLVAWPLARLLAGSLTGPDGLTLEYLRASVGARPWLGILGNSLAVAAVSTVATVAVGLLLAHAATRLDVPGRRFVTVMSLLPLVSPPFLASVALLLLLGPRGLLTGLLGGQGAARGFHAIVVAQVLTFLPHAYLRLAGVLAALDPALEEAGESLGAGRGTVLRRIVWPAARPGLASAALAVFVLCLGDLGNPLLVGGGYPVLATEIYLRVVGTNDVAAAAAMSAGLLVPCLLAHAASMAWAGPDRAVTPLRAVRPAPRPLRGAVRWSAGTLAVTVALLVALSHALVPAASLVRLWGADWSPSLRHYAFASTAEGAWPLWHSLCLAVASGVAGTLLALVVAGLAQRRQGRGARAIRALGLLPSALPGAAVGLGYLLAFGGPGLSPVGTLALLVASVVAWKLPAAIRASIATLERIDPALEEAATSLGAGRLRGLARVLLPLLGPPALSILSHFFVNGMVTVGAVIFLTSPGSTLASVAMLEQVQRGDPGAACALGTVVLGIVALAVLGLRWAAGRDRVAALAP